MQTKVLIASLLKPIDDTRGYEKLAISLQDAGKYNVHLAGPPPSESSDLSKFNTHVLKSNRRGLLNRIFSAWHFWPILIKVKPQLIIVNSHDLLNVICLYRILFGCRMIYDVQENYYLNLRYQHSYHLLVKNIAAFAIRLKERLTSPFISGYLLAEHSYSTELPFIGDRWIILENKVVERFLPQSASPETDQLQFVFTGTLSRDYGVFDAIDWFIEISKTFSKASLLISGHCTLETTTKNIKEAAKGVSNIELELFDNPISHNKVLQNIQKGSFLLLPYQPNRSTEQCIPAKLYEAIALNTPVLISKNPLWDSLIQEYKAGHSIDFARDESTILLLDGVSRNNYFHQTNKSRVFWRDEGDKLNSFIDKILSK